MLADADRSATDIGARALPILVAVAVAVFLIAPRTAPFLAVGLIAALALAMPTFEWRRLRVRFGHLDAAPVVALMGMTVWALITVLWAADRGEGLGKVALLALFATAAWAMAGYRTALADRLLREVGRGALIGMAIGLGFLIVEEVTGHAVKRLLFTVMAWARPSTKHVSVVEDTGEIVSIAAYITNRNMAALSLCVWPLLLMLWSRVVPARRLVITGGVMALAALAVALSQHDTSVLAIIAATGMLLAVARAPRIALPVIAAGWLAATLLVVPITDWAFRGAQLHQASWLPHTARQRIILWGYTAQQVYQRPLLGVGADSTKPLDARRGPKVETPAGFSYQWRTGPHAHNIYLQTWYELGLPGALLLCAFGLAVLQGISRLADPARAFLAAGFVSAAITAAFTWGLWQAWFMGAFALAGMLSLLAAEYARRASVVGDARGS